MERRFAVVDVESTGLDVARDRIVEIAVVHLDPGARPKLVFDTQVNPQQEVTWTELHGIQQWDVADAPTFEAVVGPFLESVAGRVVVAHNADFDLGIIGASLGRAGHFVDVPPHVCTLRLAQKFCATGSHALGRLCAALGIQHHEPHAARGDAMATASLLRGFIEAMHGLGIERPSDLAALHRANRGLGFVRSFRNPEWKAADLGPPSVPLRPRTGVGASYHGHLALKAYRDEVLGAVQDLVITDEELARVRGARVALGLSDAQAYAMHARVFHGYLGRFLSDDAITPDEVQDLARLASCLAQLGWSPGGPVM